MELEMYQEYFKQGEVLLSTGNHEEAMKYFKKAEAIDPQHCELYINMGIICANQDKLDEAEKTFKKALLVDKKCGEAYFHMACIAGLKEDLGQAIKYIDMAKLNGYDNAQLYFTLGMVYEEQDNINMALRNYNKALVMEPVRADIHLQKCNLLLQGGRKEEAIAALDAMILNCPDYFEGYHLKCGTLSGLGRYDEAEKVLNEALELFPQEVGFKLDRAKILISQKKYDEAENILVELEKEGDEWKREIILEQVRIAGSQENVEKTITLLERAYKECREDGKPDEEVCYLLLSVYMSAKKYDEIIKIAKEVLAVTKNNTYSNIASFYYAEALSKQNDEQEAKKVYEDTIRKCRATVLENPAAVDAYMIRALCLNRLKENDKALEMVDYVLALAPNSPEVHSARAVILKDMGLTAEMEKEVQIINQLGGKLGEIMSAL